MFYILLSYLLADSEHFQTMCNSETKQYAMDYGLTYKDLYVIMD